MCWARSSIAPLLLNWHRAAVCSYQRRTEAVLAGLALLASAALSFSGSSATPLQRPHMIFPALIWVALRLGPCLASCSVLVASGIGIGFTAVGQGPYVLGALHESLVGLQGFLANAAVTSLVLAAASAERARAVDSLAGERRALEAALGVRDEFLAVASHELRTPLAALSLQVTGLQRALQESDPSASVRPRDVDRAGRAVTQYNV